jgi:hypothetical protein
VTLDLLELLHCLVLNIQIRHLGRAEMSNSLVLRRIKSTGDPVYHASIFPTLNLLAVLDVIGGEIDAHGIVAASRACALAGR